jgi:hypothetical protein
MMGTKIAMLEVSVQRTAFSKIVYFVYVYTRRCFRLAVDVNLLDDNIDTIKKNTQSLIDASKEVGLEVNTEKSKYMLLSPRTIIRQ